jgi:hypothetical protein
MPFSPSSTPRCSCQWAEAKSDRGVSRRGTHLPGQRLPVYLCNYDCESMSLKLNLEKIAISASEPSDLRLSSPKSRAFCLSSFSRRRTRVRPILHIVLKQSVWTMSCFGRFLPVPWLGRPRFDNRPLAVLSHPTSSPSPFLFLLLTLSQTLFTIVQARTTSLPSPPSTTAALALSLQHPSSAN